MTLDQIKQMSIREYLRNRGITPKTETAHHGMYFSPLREERNASFSVDYDRNVWFDHGTGEGGSIIDLVMEMEDCTFPEAVERLQGGALNHLPHLVASPLPASSPGIEITTVRPLENPALLEYLQSRGIPATIASPYCKEVHYTINGKPYFAIGFQNDAGGWELRNAYFKGSSTPKNITTISNGSDTVMVFEGFMDFLSYLSLKNSPTPNIDTAVLNSVANLKKAIPFLESHRTIHAFLDNDEAGRRAVADLIQLIPRSEIIDQSPFYREHKDLNDYWQATLKERQKQRVKPTYPTKKTPTILPRRKGQGM